jgi:hypothetical protein
MVLGEEGPKSRHLSVCQPEQVAHWSVALERLNHTSCAR